MRELDLGELAPKGIGEMPAKIGKGTYPDFVSAVDADGNETAGIRMPDVTVPVGTHTGFNPRHPDTGGVGQLLEYVGSTLPFAKTAAEREAANDPRLSIAERYESRDTYLQRLRERRRRWSRNGTYCRAMSSSASRLQVNDTIFCTN